MSARPVVFLIAAALVLSACSSVEGESAADGSAPLTVVLFDVSRSTRDPAIRSGYEEAFLRVLQATADEHGIVVGDLIDDNPLAHSSYPIDATFPACDPLTDNQLECDARTRLAMEEATDAARRILSTEPSQTGTDIRAGVQLAERVFAAYPAASGRSLVVLSDMVEHVDAPDDAVPDLTGVRVYVVGAGVIANGELTAERIREHQRSWLGYFAEAGADLTEERYGAALVRFP